MGSIFPKIFFHIMGGGQIKRGVVFIEINLTQDMI